MTIDVHEELGKVLKRTFASEVDSTALTSEWWTERAHELVGNAGTLVIELRTDYDKRVTDRRALKVALREITTAVRRVADRPTVSPEDERGLRDIAALLSELWVNI